jgi:hypothetical protein
LHLNAIIKLNVDVVFFFRRSSDRQISPVLFLQRGLTAVEALAAGTCAHFIIEYVYSSIQLSPLDNWSKRDPVMSSKARSN